ncbi:hypothetical protein FHQ08_12270 [Lactobacillus sp. CC-MHH1034]|uniref:hypothetical protein n=1 Tax=Agrilactobacillus fermenti TaxID=2586909 RepID=UPI001E339F5F|nr:hypothetical protein [Agrilactobacillus fermenti]MCD2257461.1 hypothetical protein [Agrilactobacillus fermenti]
MANEKKLDLSAARTFLKHHRLAKNSINLTWGILTVAVLFAAGTQIIYNYQHVQVLNQYWSGFFIIIILGAILSSAYFLIIEQRDIDGVADLFTVANARDVISASDPIDSVTDLGTKYLVKSRNTTLTLDKKYTGISVSEDFEKSSYEQTIIYFDKKKFKQNFSGSGIDANIFLKALPEDYYEALTNVDQQVSTLNLTEKDYTSLLNSQTQI